MDRGNSGWAASRYGTGINEQRQYEEEDSILIRESKGLPQERLLGRRQDFFLSQHSAEAWIRNYYVFDITLTRIVMCVILIPFFPSEEASETLLESLHNSDLIRGNIDTFILRVLMDGDNYGYQIIKEIARRSGQRFELKEPTLYSSLRRLEKQELIRSYWGEETQGGRRKYYHLTPQGRERFLRNRSEWKAARVVIDDLIGYGEELDHASGLQINRQT